MSITKVSEKMLGRTGKIRNDWKREYTRTFQVFTDDAHDDQTIVLRAIDPNTPTKRIPGVGWFFETSNGFDGGAYVQEVACDCVAEDGKQWDVTVTYGPLDPTQFDAENPLEAPPKVRWGLSRTTRAADVDADGNAIINSAGQSFDPPLEKDDSRLTLTVQLNIPSFDPVEMAGYKDKINSDSWWGFDPGMVKVMNIAGDLAYSGDCPTPGGSYFDATFEFEIHEETWATEVLDQGFMYLSSGELKRCVDGDGQPVTEPVPLDGHGGQLAAGGTPVFLSINKYKAVEFSGLNLTPRGLPGG